MDFGGQGIIAPLGLNPFLLWCFFFYIIAFVLPIFYFFPEMIDFIK